MTNSRRKGADGELELAKILRGYGYEARRTAQHCGKTGDAADVVGLDGIHIEVKRAQKLNLYDAMGQAVRDSQGKSRPTVFHRKNNCEWLVSMRLDDFMALYRGDVEVVQGNG